jgi:alpha-D-ribose 1-methylphosphonate 5-triphosphate synthase subunit PhnH
MQLTPGFADPVFAAQSTFRCVMDALARPGTVHRIADAVTAPRPLSQGAAAIALTLFDQDTPIWLDAALAAEPAVAQWLRFHTGAPIVADPGQAAFGVVSDHARLPPFDDFAQGSAEYPDRSTTLILQVDTFEIGGPLTLAGPGIKDRNHLRASPLPADLPQRMAANRALFPRGVDLILASQTAVAGLPRSVRIIEEA